jgi:hypothetical protein
MIAQHLESKIVESSKEKKIAIKKTQLEIALSSNMLFVAQALECELEELRVDSEFEVFMSFLDD